MLNWSIYWFFCLCVYLWILRQFKFYCEIIAFQFYWFVFWASDYLFFINVSEQRKTNKKWIKERIKKKPNIYTIKSLLLINEGSGKYLNILTQQQGKHRSCFCFCSVHEWFEQPLQAPCVDGIRSCTKVRKQLLKNQKDKLAWNTWFNAIKDFQMQILFTPADHVNRDGIKVLWKFKIYSQIHKITMNRLIRGRRRTFLFSFNTVKIFIHL